jgi:hypothetical protein
MREMLTFSEYRVKLQESVGVKLPSLPAPKLPSLPKLPAAPKISLPKTKGAYPSTMNPMARARALRAKKKGELVHAVKQAKLLSLRTKLAKGK